MDTNNFSRRDFLSTAGKTALAATILAPIVGADIFGMSKSVPVPMQPISLNLANPEISALTKVGGALKIPNPIDKTKPIIVIRTSETSVQALSSKCTHFGCEVKLPANGTIVCPCHGAQFDLTGNVLKGPAKNPLQTYPAKLEGSIITISE